MSDVYCAGFVLERAELGDPGTSAKPLKEQVVLLVICTHRCTGWAHILTLYLFTSEFISLLRSSDLLEECGLEICKSLYTDTYGSLLIVSSVLALHYLYIKVYCVQFL